MSEEIVKINTIPNEQKYWHIRTDSGQYFEIFLEGSFIAIGWNDITVHDLERLSPVEVKAKIARIDETIDLGTRSGKQRATDIYNKILRFHNLKKDDIIVIPNINSNTLAFGKILESPTYVSAPNENGCEYTKRKRVMWLERRELALLDPVFYKIKWPRHSISEINNLGYYIDSVINTVYRKNDQSHLVFRATTANEINFRALGELLIDLSDLMKAVNNEFSLNEDIDASSVRLYLQSPGILNFKQFGISLVLTASLLGAAGCEINNQPVATQQSLQNIQQQQQDSIARINERMNTFGIKLD